jgi:hypothetical protein
MPDRLSEVTDIQLAVKQRWGIVDWAKVYPWWRPPGKVRILMYADGAVHFSGGSFMGLQYVYSLLKSRAYFYVDFQIEFAHRDGSDPTATIPGAKKLTDLDIHNKYDEIWFFGSVSNPNLTAAEVALLATFMAAPKFGGVLVTGDHADLGRGIAGQITRAGAMRKYPAPDALFPGWNTTLEDGPDPGTSFDFDDQSDDKPQTIRYRRYALSSLSPVRRAYRPHPVLCSIVGAIDVFPDHQHEGEALAPVPASGDPAWPTKAGHQEAPEVIAWGKIKDPAASNAGKEIGLVSAYNGHNVDVGRILADSTWHHWFDINLTGSLPLPSPYSGFDETAAGQTALKKIDAYFLNCGVWLAPPGKQAEMRNAAWWSILWTDRVFELSRKAPLWYYGEQALDALGRRASQCTVSEWVFDWPIFKEKIPRWEWPMLFEQFNLIDIPFERYVAGGILKHLLQEVGPWNTRLPFPQRAASDDVLERVMAAGVEEGLAAMGNDLKAEARLLTKVLENGFRVNGVREKAESVVEEALPV